MDDFPAACFGGRGISVARGRFRGLRPAAASSRNRKFKIQNSRFKIKRGCGLAWALFQVEPQPAKRPHEQPRVAGLRRRRLRPARPFQGRVPPEPSPQPSGRACDHKEQPSARGRLRAADRFAIELDARYPTANSDCDPPTSVTSNLTPAGFCRYAFGFAPSLRLRFLRRAAISTAATIAASSKKTTARHQRRSCSAASFAAKGSSPSR